MKKEDLLKIIGEDEHSLLEVKQKDVKITSDDRLVTSFEEINDFFRKNQKEPETGKGIQEYRLATRLQSIRSSKSKSEALQKYDAYGLLNTSIKEINSVNDIFESDELGILNDAEEDIFNIKNIPKYEQRKSPDYVAHRKICKDFKQYEPLFIQCQKDLASGKRILQKFTSEKEVQENRFFVLNGILLLVVDTSKTHTDKYGKINGRQRCIFENGTESEMLFRSLVQRLYENGKSVSEDITTDQEALLENFNIITKDDQKTGFIYILKSLSTDPKIQSLENLYKIGFCTNNVEERVKNASEYPTYLMAPVSIITTFECYNLNPQKLEQILHNFFESACLNLDIFDKQGKRHTPREWFLAPLEVIEQSIKLIINKQIINYQYDSEKKEVVPI